MGAAPAAQLLRALHDRELDLVVGGLTTRLHSLTVMPVSHLQQESPPQV